MRLGKVLLVVAVVLAAGCQPGGRALPVFTDPPLNFGDPGRIPTGTVTGQVIDAVTGKGVAGAFVSVENVSPLTETTTDASGHFVLSNVLQGQQFVDVARLGYEPLASRVLLAPASPAIANVIPNQTIEIPPIALTPVSPLPSPTPSAGGK